MSVTLTTLAQRRKRLRGICTHKQKQSSIPLWAIFFLIEGCPSLLLAIATFFFFPSRPETSKYLTEDERILCLTRLGRLEGNAAKEGVDWKGVRRCCKDWKTYLIAVMYSCASCAFIGRIDCRWARWLDGGETC